MFDIVVVRTDIWGKAPHRQVGGEYSGDIREPRSYNGSTLAQDARDVGSSPTLGTVFSIFRHTHDIMLTMPHAFILVLTI